MEKMEQFNKIPRLSRDMVITEKIDGSNGQIYIEAQTDMKWLIDTLAEAEQYILAQIDGYNIYAGSRKRWLDCSSKGDNMGFAKWVKENAKELLKLGTGRHFGEWYGNGIQRKYGLDEKRFALFNVNKWSDDELRPKCCEVVPVLYEGMFDTVKIAEVLEKLRIDGSSAVKGYLNPEGIVIYHKSAGKLFKKTIMDDEKPKGK